MKFTLTIIQFTFLFLIGSSSVYGQYLETFSIPNKGIFMGPCGATSSTCASTDFTMVDWDIVGNLSGIDSGDFISTDGTDLSFEDVDEDVCWESPVLDITAVAGTFSISVDVVYTGFDSEDFIDLEYSIDGAPYVQVPNQVGGGAGTLQFNTSNNDGANTLTVSGLSGSSTLSIHVCADFNLFGTFENMSMDNVTVPEANVSVLPVELISFKAEKRENQVMLNWATASELNNEKFEIEHSTDNKPFEKIGEVEGNITTLQVSNYSFNHERPTVGVNYYRLKQIDFDGQFEYSKVISLNFKGKNGEIGEFYPSPSKSGLVNLDYISQTDEEITVSVFDMTGKLLVNQTQSIARGNNNLSFDFLELNTGIYIVKIGDERNPTHRKLIIKR